MTDLIERLRFNADVLDRGGLHSGLSHTIREAATALEATREDVARYQWLRSLDGSCDGPACVNFNIGFDWIEQHGEELDAAIDAARKAAGSGS